MKTPETRYAKSGDLRIAYQVAGNGPIDLVFVPGFLSNLDVHWEDPGYNHLLQRPKCLASCAFPMNCGKSFPERRS
jgi:hypothetical protein